MTTALQARAAEDNIRRLLKLLLGPRLKGLNAFGVTFDRRHHDLVVRVDLDPAVPTKIRDQIPSEIDNVAVEVERIGPANME